MKEDAVTAPADRSAEEALAETLREAENGWQALLAASSRPPNVTHDQYVAQWLIRNAAPSSTEAGRLREALERLLVAIVACRDGADSAVKEKGAAVAFEEGHRRLEEALDEFAAAEEHARAVLESEAEHG